jgi:hypothetical protein
VTVVAALLGSWLIPQLTREWQDHQESLEIKTGLVSRMSTSVSGAVATGRFIAADLVEPTSQQREWNEGYRKWTTVSAAIGAELRAYVGETVGSDWRSFSNVVTNLLLLSADANNDPRSRRQQVEAIRADSGLRRHVRLFPAGWKVLRGPKKTEEFQLVYAELARGILERRDGLVEAVLDSGISGF